MLYNSHPVADMVKKSGEFEYKRLMLQQMFIIGGSPCGMGCSDAYRYSKPIPHYFINDWSCRVETLTNEEEEEYWIGYEYFPERRCSEYTEGY